HAVVKATAMRATLHLLTAKDYLALRGTLHTVLAAASGSIAKSREADFDLDEILAAARRFLAEEPHTFAEITTMLYELKPDTDLGSMRYTVRTHLPLVQVPISTGWSYPGNPKFTLAEAWLGQPIPPSQDLRALILRYIAAFGPATVNDIQTWSGLQKMKDTVEKLKPELQVYTDEKRREYFDLPDASLPDADTPSP